MNFIKRLFGITETNLDSILSSFKKTLADLNAHIAYHDELCVSKAKEAALRKAESIAHNDASEKAANVYNKIADLIGEAV